MSDDEQIRLLADRHEVEQVIFRFANAFDLQNWDSLRSCFTDLIDVDYTSFRGEKRTLEADEYVAQRQTSLHGVKTQHLSFNHEIKIEHDQAFCRSASLIFRFAPAMESDNSFNTHCFYEYNLVKTPEGWKITKIKQEVLWHEGNPKVHGFRRSPEVERKD